MIGRTYSHFKIVEKIGGGMGVVYRAEDTVSGDTVALKFLPPEFTAVESARKRFIREAQAVSALNHPNICAINDVVETPDGRMFIAMPLYDGETLRDRIEQGPLPIQEAAEIAHEIAMGLSYAHEQDVVHRDIKPDNIFLVGGELVKILDFGLAKLTGQSRVTPARARLGTMAYLSPEQARGDDVDHRTDIWSLGATLFEMLTGQVPFPGDAEQAIIYSVLNEEPASVTDLRPDCPQHLADIVRRCLQKNPDGRFQSLSEFIQQLKILAGSLRMDHALFTRAQKEAPVAGAASTLGRVFWPVAAVIAVLVVTSIVLWWELGTDLGPVLVEGQTSVRIAVLPLENHAGEEPGDEFVDGLSATVASTAAELEPYHKSMWVMPYSRTSSGNREDPQAVRGAFGVNMLLGGSVDQRGQDLRLTLEILDAESLEPIESKRIDFKRASPQSLHTDVFDAVADLLDVDAPAEVYPSPQPRGAAGIYESYLEGVGILRRSDDENEVDQAIQSLQRTVENDPSFAEAHLWLAEAFQEKSRYTGETVWLERAEESCKRALELNVSMERAHVALADVYEATNRRNLALQFYANAVASNPHHTHANVKMGDMLASQNRVDQAEKSYLKLIEVEPDYFEGHRALGRFYHTTGRIDDAVVKYEDALRLAPGDWWTLNRLAAAYHELGRWEEAKQTCARSFSIDRRLALEDFRSDPMLGKLNADPRFQRLAGQTGFDAGAETPADSSK